MDPNTLIKEILLLSNKIQKQDDEGRTIDPFMSAELADKVLNLDAWICKKGALPERWNR